MKALMTLIMALTIPLVALNWLGGIVSGIWLAILGQWGAVISGIIFLLFSSWIIPFALAPSLLLGAPIAYYMERDKISGVIILGGLSSLYTMALITVWCCGILFLFVNGATETSLIPLLIWSFGIATGPWIALSSREGSGDGNNASFIAALLAQIAFVVVALKLLFSGLSLFAALKVFGSFMAVGFVIQFTMVVMMMQEQRRASLELAKTSRETTE